MNKFIFSVFIVCFMICNFEAEAQLINIAVKYKSNGVWHTKNITPGGSTGVTVEPDQGTSVNVTLTRADDGKEALFSLADVWNGKMHTYTTKSTYHTFYSCIGSSDTQVIVNVEPPSQNSMFVIKWKNPPTADLSVTALRVNGSVNNNQTFHVGETVTIEGRVENNGGNRSESCYLGYYLKTSKNSTSGSPFSTSPIEALNAGRYTICKTTYTFKSNDAGSRYFVYEADYLDNVDEDIKNNNVNSFGPFQVVGAPSLSLSPGNFQFGDIEVDKCSDEKSFQLINDGNVSISGNVAVSNTTNYTITSGGGSFTLNPGRSKTIEVQFCPQSAGEKKAYLRVWVDGITSPFAQASITGNGVTPPESIIGISPEFTFDTRAPFVNSSGIFLKIIETADNDSNMVKKVGYEYSYKKIDGISVENTNKYEVKDGFVFLSPPEYPDNAKNKVDFLDQILLFDENDNQVGHIKFSYSFEWEGMHSRHAVLFFHNDGPVFGGSKSDPNRYFPYHLNNPNNKDLSGDYVRYDYYQDGEYPVSMLIPPHFLADENNPMGYRFPTEFNKTPVLFVHGLTGTFSYQKEAKPELTESKGTQTSYWYDTPIKFNKKGKYHAWQFYYPNEDDLVHCGMMLKNAVNYLYKKYKNSINFVSHSMGCPVTMEYLTTAGNFSTEKIGKVLLSTPPIHGSLAANRNYRTIEGVIMQELGQDGKAPAYRDLSFGSDFMYKLHQRVWDKELCDNTFVVVGLTTKDYKKDLPIVGKYNKFTNLHNEADNHSDGLVSFSSGSLLDKGIGFLGIYGNHDDGKYSKTLSYPDFWPNLLDAYFSDNNPVNSAFENYCLNDELVEIYVKGDKTIRKPNGASLSTILSDRKDVDFQKGGITLILENENSIELNLYLRERSFTTDYTLRGYALSSQELKSKTDDNYSNTFLGKFRKNLYFQTNQDTNSYYFIKDVNKIPIINLDVEWWDNTGFELSEGTLPITKFQPDNFPYTDYIDYIDPLYMQHQFIGVGDISHKSSILVASEHIATESTPTKSIQFTLINGEQSAPVYVDDQTHSIDFYLYSDDLAYTDIEYSMVLNSPEGHDIIAGYENTEHTVSSNNGMNILTVHHPAPGIWHVTPVVDSDYAADIHFITKGKLASDIKASSLIEQFGHDVNLSSKLSGKISIPDLDLFAPNKFDAFLIIRSGGEVNDTLALNNIEYEDKEIIFENEYKAAYPGVYTYTMIITGEYNGYRFERAVYGDFLVENLTASFSIPDQEMNVTNRFIQLNLPQYLICPQCDNEEIYFEVGTENSTFNSDDFYYSFSTENDILTLNVSQNAELGEAWFYIDAFMGDSLIASTNFRARYSSPGVPNNLTSSSMTLNSAELSWIPGGSENLWDIIYGPAGFNLETGGALVESVDERPFTLENLAQGSDYEFYVRAVFPEDTIKSAWSWPGSFGTNHLVTISSEAGGNANPEGETEVMHNGNLTVHFIPDDGYHVHDVLVDGESIGNVSSYQFANVTGNHNIHALFEINTYNIKAVANPPNSGIVEGTGEFTHGESVTLIATPLEGFRFVNWTENGAETGQDSIFNFLTYNSRNLQANFTSTTNLQAMEKGNILIYPNPASNLINIESKGGEILKQVIVYNITGQVIVNIKIKSEYSCQLNVAGYVPGVYLMQVVTSKGILNAKIQVVN